MNPGELNKTAVTPSFGSVSLLPSEEIVADPESINSIIDGALYLGKYDHGLSESLTSIHQSFGVLSACQQLNQPSYAIVWE